MGDICAERKKGHGTIVSTIFGMMIYLLWRDMNKIIFQSGSSSLGTLCREIAIYIHIRGNLYPIWQKHLE